MTSALDPWRVAHGRDFLRACVAASGLSMTAFAAHYGVSDSLICLVCSGKKPLSRKLFALLLETPVLPGGSFHLAAFAPREAPDSRADSVREAVRQLSDRQRLVIDRRWFSGDAPVNYAAVGRQLGLTRERVRQIEAEAFRRLRRRLERA